MKIRESLKPSAAVQPVLLSPVKNNILVLGDESARGVAATKVYDLQRFLHP